MRKNKNRKFQPVISGLFVVSLSINLLLFTNLCKYKNLNISLNTQLFNMEATRNINPSEAIQKQNDIYYEGKLHKLMDTEELTFLAQRLWLYKLTENGREISGNIIYTSDKNIKISLTELKDNTNLLPKSILIKGNLSGGDSNDDFSKHIIIVSIPTYSKNDESSEQGRKISFEFKDLKTGDIVNLRLSYVLMTKLKLKNDLIQIIVK